MAVVLPWTPETGLSESQWEHEIVQKWAYLMEEQRLEASFGTAWQRDADGPWASAAPRTA